MAVKNGIGYSPLTDKVYLGKQNTEKRLWVGDKKDITNEFLAVASEFFEENTVRDIGRSNGESNLFINIKNDKASIEKVIKNLTKRVGSLKQPITSKLANICRTFMAKLNHIRRYRFDDETNLVLQKLGKKEAQEVRQCIREMLEKKGLLKPIKLPF